MSHQNSLRLARPEKSVNLENPLEMASVNPMRVIVPRTRMSM